MTMANEAVAQQIMSVVQSLLEGLVQDHYEAVSTALIPGGFLDVGRQIFGLDAVSVPLGFAVGPHHLSITTLQAGDLAAVAELQGRDAADNLVCSSSVFLSQHGDQWRIEDIWPVPVGNDLDVSEIPEPTGLFYSGDLQLEIVTDAGLDPVELLLVPGLQEAGIGLHLIERGVHLWRTFNETTAPDQSEAAAWAAAVHLVLLLLEDEEPDPSAVIAAYGAHEETALQALSALVQLLNAPSSEEVAPAPTIITPSSQLLDSSGRPIQSGRQGGSGKQGGSGIILPHG